MSKQSEAKTAQGYVEKHISKTCANCKHFTSTMTTQQTPWGTNTFESDERCTLGNFSVKKTATCKQFEVKV